MSVQRKGRDETVLEEEGITVKEDRPGEPRQSFPS